MKKDVAGPEVDDADAVLATERLLGLRGEQPADGENGGGLWMQATSPTSS